MARQGKIRAYGLSNETPWGTLRHLNEHEKQPENRLRLASVQNPYSLLNRSYETGMAELSLRENIPLLGYSPLGMGILTGKYRHGAKPEGARLTVYERFVRYNLPKAHEAGLTLIQLSLAFTNHRPFTASNIIGATNLAQLAENIGSADIALSQDIWDALDAVHKDISNPCP